ncbi:hypothetical protein TNCV_2221471 [Trichonephila clavipes]|nr:hypothetical protein TNCV_2221471 [Trichonephila clavipes]
MAIAEGSRKSEPRSNNETTSEPLHPPPPFQIATPYFMEGREVSKNLVHISPSTRQVFSNTRAQNHGTSTTSL